MPRWKRKAELEQCGMNGKASADCQEHLPVLGQPKATLWVVAFQEEKKGGVFIEHSREKGCRLHPGLGLARWYCSTRVSKTPRAAREQCQVCTRAKALGSHGFGSAWRYTDTGDGSFKTLWL